MHVFASPFKGAAPNASVLFGVEMRGRDLKVDANSKILLSYIAIDATGKVRGGNTDSLTLTNLKPESKARIEQTGLRMLNRLDLPPGKYQLRIAAHDSAGGNVGSVQYDLEVPDYAKVPFSMSGLVLTSASGLALPTVKADEQLKPMLPGPPIARRAFPQNDEVALFTEVYDNAGATPHKVDITTTVTTDEGSVLFKTEETRDSTDLAGKRGGYGYTTRIPMKDLALGSYVLKVEAKSRLGADAACRARTAIRRRGAAAGAGAMIAAGRRARDCSRAGLPGERKPDRHDARSTEYADDRQRRSEQHRRRETGAGPDRGRVDETVAAACAQSASSGGGFLEGDGRRRLHGQPAECRLQHGDRQRDGGAERRAHRALYRDAAGPGQHQCADSHLSLSPRRDSQIGGDRREVREGREIAISESSRAS